MRVERARPGVLHVTLHAYEMAALIAAARWAVESAPGQLPADAVEQLRDVLAGYDEAVSRMEGG